jgi:hypothetical protein
MESNIAGSMHEGDEHFNGWESYIDNLLNELIPWCKLPHRAVGNPPRSPSESSQRRSQVQHHLPCDVTLGRK